MFDLFLKKSGQLGLWLVATLSLCLSVTSTLFFYQRHLLVAYGDAESHLNIAKRVVDSITPGAAQLGGIWLPIPHLLMVPLVANDSLWRTGLAGSIVSGASFVIASMFLYLTIKLVTQSPRSAVFGTLIFMVNPNVLYMQSTAMTELPLIAFFTASTYFFIKFLLKPTDSTSLIFAAVFGFCASLSRYDGWFLVLVEGMLIWLRYLRRLQDRKVRKVAEGYFILFSVVAFFGIFLWLVWGQIILGDPLYFTNSPFSAKSQQMGWQSQGELPSYKNLPSAVEYYSVTSAANIGYILVATALVGLLWFVLNYKKPNQVLIAILLGVPFIFYVVTLYLGQSVIFIPGLTPDTFQWNLFNVRYGMMMVPVAAFFGGYLFYQWRWWGLRLLLVGVLLLQTWYFSTGKIPIVTLDDATQGLSASVPIAPEAWMASHYDHGLILIDDFARTISITRSNLPMESIIYVGNKPYWEESLAEPEKYVTWIVMQENDTLWQKLYDDPEQRGRLYAHFQKVYTSPKILIFKRME